MTQFAWLLTLPTSVRLRDVGLEEVVLQRVEPRRVGGEEERGAVGAHLGLVLAHRLGQDEREERRHERGAVLGQRPAAGQSVKIGNSFLRMLKILQKCAKLHKMILMTIKTFLITICIPCQRCFA